DGPSRQVFNSVMEMLKSVLGVPASQTAILDLGHRNSRRLAVVLNQGTPEERRIPNLLGLSAGQSALFCVFCTIIRDFELAGLRFSQLKDVRGVVLIDEADLHLHVDLQYRVLPELIKLFPRVQFILTAHSPLVVMGMKEAFGEDGFWLLDMPST